MLHAIADLFKELTAGSEVRGGFLEEVNALFQDLAGNLVAFVLVLHELVL